MQDLMVYGVHPVEHALALGHERLRRVCVRQGRHAPGSALGKLLKQLHGMHCPYDTVEAAELDRWTACARHQGVVLWLRGGVERDETALRQDVAAQPQGRWLLLDGVQDPRNLGACLRNADAAGARGVILPGRHSTPINALVVKTSAGAALHVPVYRVSNMARAMQHLQTHGVWLYGLDERADSSLFSCALPEACGFVLGAEGQGLRRLSRERCDILLGIPMQGTVSSLNLSVVSALCLFHAVQGELVAPS